MWMPLLGAPLSHPRHDPCQSGQICLVFGTMPGPCTTDELIDALKRVGLSVTENMLWQDRHARYLPPDGGETRGRGRLWQPWEQRRARYLYWLRKRGMKGDMLRVFLFLRDGWGWQDVQPLAVAGLKKAIAAQSAPVRSRFRNPNERALAEYIRDIAADVELRSESVARFIYGMGTLGRPLPGASLQDLLERAGSLFPSLAGDGYRKLVEALIRNVGLSWNGTLVLVQAASSDDANDARLQFRVFLRDRRQDIRPHLQGGSSDPLTLCGQVRSVPVRQFRNSPKRITPAQALAALVGVHIAVLSTLKAKGFRIE